VDTQAKAANKIIAIFPATLGLVMLLRSGIA
jgi:hypothetical protein